MRVPLNSPCVPFRTRPASPSEPALPANLNIPPCVPFRTHALFTVALSLTARCPCVANPSGIPVCRLPDCTLPSPG
ncbi:hypothetical protein T492DRAFT_1011030 [Pavlovales sp. CCMP2436]|nr:hypothetical protein T492DRAFT_1011030 [Pavlovales sp. CCMP2436]